MTGQSKHNEETKTGESRGRPRNPEVDRVILEATIEILGQIGYSGMSIEGVAARSGVAKTTIYRRFDSKLELVLNAMNQSLAINEVPNTGSLRGDLKAMLIDSGGLMFLGGRGAAIVGTLLVEREQHPELLEPFHRLIFEPRQRQLHEIFNRANQRGEIDADADHQFVGASLFGSVVVSALTGRQLDESAVDRLLDNIIRSLSTPEVG